MRFVFRDLLPGDRREEGLARGERSESGQQQGEDSWEPQWRYTESKELNGVKDNSKDFSPWS